MNVFAFAVPQAKGFDIPAAKGIIRAAYEGLVYADAQTNVVMRIEMQCVSIPADAAYSVVKLRIDYKATKVAGRPLILMSSYLLLYRTARIKADGTLQAEYWIVAVWA
jgi:hypothetical protein